MRDVINDLMGKGNKKILLNLVGVNYIDSSGIGVLVSSFSTVRSQGGQLKMVNLSKRIHDLLQITKVYSLFDVKDDEAAAVGMVWPIILEMLGFRVASSYGRGIRESTYLVSWREPPNPKPCLTTG